MGNVRFLVINVLNDCRICMCLIVCLYAGISRRNYFKGWGGLKSVKTGKKCIFLEKKGKMVNFIGSI